MGRYKYGGTNRRLEITALFQDEELTALASTQQKKIVTVKMGACTLHRLGDRR